MTDFAYAHASDADLRTLAEDCATQLAGASGHTVGFLYVTHPLAGALGDIVDILKARTGVQSWFGTVGIGVCATGAEHFGTPAVAALTGRFSDDTYRVIGPVNTPDDAGGAVGTGFAGTFGVVHGDPRNPQASEIVAEIAGRHGVYLVGGLSAAETRFPQVAGSVTDGGVSGVLLGGRLRIAVGLTQGCSPIGPVHEVSRGEGHVVATLDNRPALDVLCEDLGVADGVDPSPWLGNVHAALPVAGSNDSDYLVRNLVGLEPTNGYVVVADEMSDGDQLMFVRRDAESAEKDLRRMLDDLAAGCSGKPRAGLYYSCVARGPNLFADQGHELKMIGDVFGDMPLAGFFGNGEISNDRVYGYTGVLALFL